MKLGLRLEPLGVPFRRGLEQAARLGVSVVQADAAGELAPAQLSKTGRHEIVTLLRSFNLELAAVHCPLRRGLDTAENAQQRIDRVRDAMSLARELGAPVAVVEMPAIPNPPAEATVQPAAGGILLGSASTTLHPATILRDALTELGRHGDRVGTQLALEIGLDPVERVVEYLGPFATGSLRVSFDPANMLLNGRDPVASLTPLGGRVAHVRARDARRGGAGRGGVETPVGAGDVNWMVLIAVLESLKFSRGVIVDRQEGSQRARDVADGVQFLRRFIPAKAA